MGILILVCGGIMVVGAVATLVGLHRLPGRPPEYKFKDSVTRSHEEPKRQVSAGTR